MSVDYDFFAEESTEKSLLFFLEIIRLIRFPNYKIYLSSDTNLYSQKSYLYAKISYQDPEKPDSYFILQPSQLAKLADYVLWTQNHNLFQFYDMQFQNIKLLSKDIGDQYSYQQGGASVNDAIGADLSYKWRFVLHPDPCIDGIPSSILVSAFQNMDNDNKKRIRKFLDPNGQFDDLFSDDVFFQQQIQFCKKRFEYSESKPCTTVVDYRSFLTFVRNRSLKELGGYPVFNASARKQILDYILTHLGDADSIGQTGHQYYFADLYSKSVGLYVCCYDNSFFSLSYSVTDRVEYVIFLHNIKFQSLFHRITTKYMPQYVRPKEEMTSLLENLRNSIVDKQ